MLTFPIIDSQAFEIIIIIFCGLVFGSFASALTYRIPRNISWITKGNSEHGLRSACPVCKTYLTLRDLIPIASWLLSKGKCRHCGAAVSMTYPICEILTLLGFIGIYTVFGLTWLSLPYYLMVPFLVSLIMIDFEHMILPNQLVAIVFVLGVLVALLKVFNASTFDASLAYASGALVFPLFAWSLGAIMKKTLKKDALGFGDVKFFAAAGVWLGLPAIGHFCIAGGAIGIALGLIWKKIKKEEIFPFGPALIVSFYAILLLQGSH